MVFCSPETTRHDDAFRSERFPTASDSKLLTVRKARQIIRHLKWAIRKFRKCLLDDSSETVHRSPFLAYSRCSDVYQSKKRKTYIGGPDHSEMLENVRNRVFYT